MIQQAERAAAALRDELSSRPSVTVVTRSADESARSVHSAIGGPVAES